MGTIAQHDPGHHDNGHVFAAVKHDFDLEHVLDALNRCPLENDDVDMQQYLLAYNELCR